MYTLATSTPPLPSLKRIRREIESKRIEKLKKIHESAKQLAREEFQFIKDLFPPDDDDDDIGIPSSKRT